MSELGLEPCGSTSNKPTHYLLDYGVYCTILIPSNTDCPSLENKKITSLVKKEEFLFCSWPFHGHKFFITLVKL